ncbi:MAG: tetratricopeptide repeat protein [Nannocystaceae bacterium]
MGLGFAMGLGLTMVACSRRAHDVRSLHYVDGELRSSPPVTPRSYTAYFRARMALEERPPNYDAAREQLGVALRDTPEDPHLWTVLGEIEEQAGRPEPAMIAARKALTFEPGYTRARQLRARLSK